MQRSLRVGTALLAILMLAACASVVSDDQPALEKGFGVFSIIKEDRNMAVVVDYELALQRMDEFYFPLEVKIVNKRLEGLTLDRESFILVDENGEAYNMPQKGELEMYYNKLALDHRFKGQTGLLGDQILTSFSYYRRSESNFFPQTQGAARTYNTVYVRNKGFMEDLIYFPKPLDGLEGKLLRLRIDALELEVPYEIRFVVGLKKKR